LITAVDGLKINYSTKGSGAYVFLLHGWGANLDLFAGLANELSEKYTVVSMDFPGFGQSEEPNSDWSVSDYAQFTASFIQQFDCTNVILLGHSFGGRVIIKLSSLPDLPFAIDQIILVDSAGILKSRTPKNRARVAAFKAGKFVLNTPPMRKAAPGAVDNLRKKMGSADYVLASERMRNILVKTVNEDLEPLLGSITAQTLLIWGEQDTATPVADARRMEQLISAAGTDVGLVVLDNAGHYSFLDQAYTFHQVVRSFLRIG